MQLSIDLLENKQKKKKGKERHLPRQPELVCLSFMAISFSYKNQRKPCTFSFEAILPLPRKKRRDQIDQWELAGPESQETLYFSTTWFARALRVSKVCKMIWPASSQPGFRSEMRWTRVEKAVGWCFNPKPLFKWLTSVSQGIWGEGGDLAYTSSVSGQSLPQMPNI